MGSESAPIFRSYARRPLSTNGATDPFNTRIFERGLLVESPLTRYIAAVPGRQPIVSDMYSRQDPFTGDWLIVSKMRASRPLTSVKVRITYDKDCDFCHPFEGTPEPKIFHFGGAVSFPNLYPWSGGTPNIDAIPEGATSQGPFQWVTVFPPFNNKGEKQDIKHVLFISEMNYNMVTSLMDAAFDLSLKCSEQGAEAVFVFMNWGVYAGASKQHPHLQVVPANNFVEIPLPNNRLKREMDRAREYCFQTGRNLFDDYIQAERDAGKRIIFENADAVILAPFASTATNEVLIIPKRCWASIADASDVQARRNFARAILGIFPFSYFYRGVTNFNLVLHHAPFASWAEDFEAGTKPIDYYRLHFHFIPRRAGPTADIAGAEIGYDIGIIASHAEDVAEAGRKWYSRPREEDIPDALKIDRALVQQFRLHMRGERATEFYSVQPETDSLR